MSVEEYERAAPRLFTKVQEGVQPVAPPRAWKGFADIVEYQTETLSGRKNEIIPIDRLDPKKKRRERKGPMYEDYAVVLRRTWMQQRHTSILVRIELEIQSEELCVAFREIAINTYERTDLNSFPIKLPSPFSELFFYRDEIRKLADNDQKSDKLRREAQVLYDFVTGNGLMTSIIFDHNKYSAKGQVVNDILWTIYPPNSLLVVNIGMIQECWICCNVSTKNNWKGFSWVLEGLRIGFDGSSVGMTRQKFTIPMKALGICKISDLPVVPFEHYKDQKKLREQLTARATNLQQIIGSDFTKFSPKEYKGAVWSDEFYEYDADFKPSPNPKRIDERVMVDFKAYRESHAKQSTDLEAVKKAVNTPRKGKGKFKPRGIMQHKDVQPVKNYSLDFKGEVEFLAPEEEEDPMSAEAFSSRRGTQEASEDDSGSIMSLLETIIEIFHVSEEDFKLLFPAMVPAFGLKAKHWWWLIVDELREVQWNAAAFKTLQLEEDKKDVIQSLIKGHQSGSVIFDDVVFGKGQGLIFLLHGQPGLGKTLTGESVAEDLKRPLYTISGGELSTNVTTLERKLDSIFEIVKRWDAVCLLDEADVLLCKRNSFEMNRNAIVAVFLRKLEYFQGVLILTTNRNQDFDDAFKSRIHVTLLYPPLTQDARTNIWKGLIEANNQVALDGTWTKEAFEDLGKHDLNGRRIKNILRTAVAYANAKNESLGTSHVNIIIDTELKEDD
ncbi:P-loop containing nucleoside triphosphate hydrolase protein [Xylaria arbuscula]|nr:P-loop containing nucleoside triphosphate hydrolase protein [Xylaria arbuscula]